MSVDRNMINYQTRYYTRQVDFISAEGPLRGTEVENADRDLGTREELSIPPEDAEIAKEWNQHVAGLRRAIGKKALDMKNN